MKRTPLWVKWAAVGLLILPLLPGCGSSDEAGPEQTTPPTYTRESMIEACVRMHSCGVFQLTHVQNCILDYESRVAVPSGQKALYKHLHQCVNAAKGDCTKVRACFGNQPSDPECSGSYQGGCDGEVARYCETLDKRIYRVDCAKGGLKCAVDQYGQPFCGGGTCSDNKFRECRDNNKLYVACDGSGVHIEDCSWLGLACGKDSKGELGCRATGKACSG